MNETVLIKKLVECKMRSFLCHRCHLIALFFVHGETVNQQQTMIFWQFRSSRLCMNFHVGTFRLHVHFRSNLNFPLEQPMKFVLTSRDVPMMEIGWLLHSWLFFYQICRSGVSLISFRMCVSLSFFPFFQPWFLTLLSWILTFPGLWEISFSSQIIIVKPSVFGLRQNLEVIILSFLPAGCLSF